MDLVNGFFQNHSSPTDYQWLGISTPFKGLRFLKRSGQGLISQSEELDELLSKVLGEELKNGIASRLADNLYVGGITPQEAIENYAHVLSKLQNANLKISPSKTKIFLKSVDVLGWKWLQGGFLEPSPHRVNALRNTKIENIKTIKIQHIWCCHNFRYASPKYIMHTLHIQYIYIQFKWLHSLTIHYANIS